jgi:hypothetical protein
MSEISQLSLAVVTGKAEGRKILKYLETFFAKFQAAKSHEKAIGRLQRGRETGFSNS